MGYDYRYDYWAMPQSTASAEGMRIIRGDLENFRVKILPDIVYAAKDGRDLHIRLLKPIPLEKEADQRTYPLLIHIQGSGWAKQDLNDHVLDFKEIAKAGFLIAIVEYRDSSVAKIPGQVYDAKDAARYLAGHQEELGFDKDRIYLSGDSSGGHTALLCWATWPSGLLDEKKEKLPRIRAFLDFYGVTDLAGFLTQVSAIEHRGVSSPEGLALGGALEDPAMEERIRKASVFTYLDPKTENQPLLMLHGNKDRLVPFEQSVLLYEAARKLKKDVTFYCVDQADHGGSAFFCDAVYQVILDYLKQH